MGYTVTVRDASPIWRSAWFMIERTPLPLTKSSSLDPPQDLFNRFNILTFIPKIDLSGRPMGVQRSVLGHPTLRAGSSFVSEESEWDKFALLILLCLLNYTLE